MHFVHISQNGSPFHLDIDRVESVREVPPTSGYSRGFAAPKGALLIYAVDASMPYVLTANADINAFYAAFSGVAYPGSPVLTSTLGT